MRKLFRLGLCSLLMLAPVLVMTACQREEPETPVTAQPAVPPAAAVFQVLSLELGNALGADRRVVAPATVFVPTDTIYASVIGNGVLGTALTARWTYENAQIVSESTETLDSTDTSLLEFHISKPTGWPAGRYTVEILANGAHAGTREFEVRQGY